MHTLCLVQRYMLELNFEDCGFTNVVIKNDPSYVHLKTCIRSSDEAWKWKEILEEKNHLRFNAKEKENSLSLYHQRFICLHGEKRHKGKIKTYTG